MVYSINFSDPQILVLITRGLKSPDALASAQQEIINVVVETMAEKWQLEETLQDIEPTTRLEPVVKKSKRTIPSKPTLLKKK